MSEAASGSTAPAAAAVSAPPVIPAKLRVGSSLGRGAPGGSPHSAPPAVGGSNVQTVGSDGSGDDSGAPPIPGLWSRCSGWCPSWQMLAGVYIFLLGSYVNSAMQVYMEHRSPLQPPLPDLGFEVFPHFPHYKVADAWDIGMCVLTFLRFFRAAPRCRSQVFRRFFFLQGVLFMFRAVSISATNLATPLTNCVNTATGHPLLEAFYIMAGIHYTCGDCLFSGHSVNITLLALTWQTYSDGTEMRWLKDRCGVRAIPERLLRAKRNARGDSVNWTLTNIVAWCVATAGYIVLVATRFHYTVDVFIGALLAVLCFQLYIHYVRTCHERDSYVNRFLCWFESIDPPQPLLFSPAPPTGKHGRHLSSGAGQIEPLPAAAVIAPASLPHPPAQVPVVLHAPVAAGANHEHNGHHDDGSGNDDEQHNGSRGNSHRSPQRTPPTGSNGSGVSHRLKRTTSAPAPKHLTDTY